MNFKGVNAIKIDWRRVVLAVCIGTFYFVYGKLGLQVASVNASTTPIWVPTAIAIATFVLFGYRMWPVIFVPAFLVNFTTTGFITSSFFIALGNTLEGLTAAYFINKFAGGKKLFERPRNFYSFVFFAVFVSTTISATIGVATLYLTGLGTLDEFIWLTWWLGDALGALIFTPPLILWGLNTKPRPKKVYEFIIYVILILGVGWLMVNESFYFSYLIIPVFIWAALRFSARGTTTGIALFAVVEIASVVLDNHTLATFLGGPQNSSIILIQAYTAFLSVIILPLSTSLHRRAQLEEEALRKREEEEEKMRMEFFANAAHELRTPLTVMKGNIDLALRDGTTLEESRTTLKLIDEEITHLSSILSDLLLFGMREEKTANIPGEKIDMPKFIDKIAARYRAPAHSKKNISIKIDSIPPATILANKIYVEKVFSNIIKNAIAYGKPNGEINISGEKEGNKIKITIADNGIGISPQNLSKIFDRFFRAKREGNEENVHTGLGLSIVKQIVEEYKGSVSVESVLGEGTSFTVSLPTIYN